MKPAALIGLLLLMACDVAVAHDVRPAYLQISELAPQRFEVLWKQPVMIDRRLPINLSLPNGCESASAHALEHTGSALIESWIVNCDLRSGVIGISGLSATLTDVLLRITYLDAEGVNRILRPSSPQLDLASSSPGVGAYFLLGVEHLLLGIDHILFVIGLALFISGPWLLVKTVTAFTIAHSITLAMSVLELVVLPQGPVEAVIALSILFLARELVVPEDRRSRITEAAPWVMAFGFGLLHGFGFAGALADIGLPREHLAMSLLLFNLGIEAGQLVVIGLMVSGGWLVRQLLRRWAFVMERGFALAMGCVAAFWTIDRIVVIG